LASRGLRHVVEPFTCGRMSSLQTSLGFEVLGSIE
jgi:hypothetical protein